MHLNGYALLVERKTLKIQISAVNADQKRIVNKEGAIKMLMKLIAYLLIVAAVCSIIGGMTEVALFSTLGTIDFVEQV